MNQRQISDCILVLSVLAGLFSSLAIAGIVLAVLVRGEYLRVKLHAYHCMLIAAACWAGFVISMRGLDSFQGQLPYLIFLWTLPLLMACYRPNGDSLRAFSRMILAVFFVDLLFNLYSLTFGADLLGRSVDLRSAIFDARHGGLFAHSFYSGAISIAAAVSLLGRGGSLRFSMLLPFANLLLAGSWRLMVAIPLVLLFLAVWRRKSRVAEILLVVAASIALVAGIVVTSAFVSTSLENDSNSYRLISWILALEKIEASPWTGVGVPNAAAVHDKGVSFEVLDENFIGESSYLNNALSFGIPYAIFFFLTFALAFWGRTFSTRTVQMAVLYPYVVVDMVYGEFFGSVLIYCWLWLLVSSGDCSPDSVVAHQPHRQPDGGLKSERLRNSTI
jgi:hypothetical protein